LDAYNYASKRRKNMVGIESKIDYSSFDEFALVLVIVYYIRN